MNLDQIAARIAAPNTCIGTEIPALKELTEKYPFAQVFSILYLKALSNQNDLGFDEALQKHAYKITDRMKLYDLIHDRGVFVEEEIVEKEIVEEDVKEILDVTSIATAAEAEVDLEDVETTAISEIDNNDISVSIPVEEEDVNVSVEAEIASPPPSIPPQGGKEDSLSIIELIQEPEHNDPPPQSPSEGGRIEEEHAEDFIPKLVKDELELEIISQVVATVYNDNLEHSIPEKPVEEKKSETLITPAADVEKAVLESKRSFSSWLKAGNQEASAAEKPKAAEPAEEVKVIEKQTDKIIDAFIEKEPTISRPKKEFYSPTKKAKESVSSEGLIYTETLADIFAIQGNFPKAIVAYEQLMLTNPEKKIFFAQRIKELKEKLNT